MPRRSEWRALNDKRRRLENELMLLNFEIEADPSAFELGSAVWSWLKRQRDWKLTYDASLYSQYRWDSVRAEPYGRGAIFTITSEGPLAHTINQPDHPDDFRLIERFDRMIGDLGISYEMGYSWSFHFHPVS